MTTMEMSQEEEQQLAAMLDSLAEALETDPSFSAAVRNDLHAIRAGEDTIFKYDLLQWWRIKTALGDISEEDLTALIGEKD